VVRKTNDRGKKTPPKRTSGAVPRTVTTKKVLRNETNSSIENFLYVPKNLLSSNKRNRKETAKTKVKLAEFCKTWKLGSRSNRKINERNPANCQVTKSRNVHLALAKVFKIQLLGLAIGLTPKGEFYSLK
jgi:hypothetical protein